MSSGVAVKDAAFAPTAGELIAGQYRVERVLGTGGMGVVVAATDLRTRERVAIKLLRAAEERRAVERFFREARAMSRLSTEHVVRVIEAGTADNRPYLVMEQLDGQDFAEQARGGRKLPMREVVDATVQACEALSHAHRAGIVHRDLKPSNLFLHTQAGTRPVVKLLDFGISKVKSKEEWEKTLTATNDGGVLGSPPYMSPEQVRDPKKVDARSDVWALGIVMYKLLAGKLPFDGDSVGEVFARVLERPYPSLRAWGGVDVPPELDAIVGRCLAKDRRDRFQHTGDLALALAAFASPEWSELAHRMALRLREDPPTVDDGGEGAATPSRPPSDPHTLTLDQTDPGLGIPPPAMATPFEVTPPSYVMGPGTPGFGVAIPRHVASGPTTASATFGPAVIDPRVLPDPSAGAHGGPRRAGGIGALAAGVLLVVLGGVVVGYRVRATHDVSGRGGAPETTATQTTAQPVALTASATPSVESAKAPVAVAVTATAPSATTPARPAGRPGARRQAGGSTTTAAVSTGASAATPAPTPSATPRPELHPNPYGQ